MIRVCRVTNNAILADEDKSLDVTCGLRPTHWQTGKSFFKKKIWTNCLTRYSNQNYHAYISTEASFVRQCGDKYSTGCCITISIHHCIRHIFQYLVLRIKSKWMQKFSNRSSSSCNFQFVMTMMCTYTNIIVNCSHVLTITYW